MAFGWTLLCCILWILQECVIGECMGMCNSPSQCKINFSMKDSNVSSKDSPFCPPSGYDIVTCNRIPSPKMSSGVQEDPGPIEVKFYCLSGKVQCEKIKGDSHLFNMKYCCENYSCEPEITCKVDCGMNADCTAEDDEEGGGHNSLPGAIGGALGTLIVIILLSMVALQLIQMHQKRELEKHQRGARRGDYPSQNMPYIHSLPQPRHELPAPQYARLEPPVYAELEANNNSGHIENYYSNQHVYEEPDKYFKCRPTYDNSKTADDTISPPCDDDYANPNDAIIFDGSENQAQTTINMVAEVEKETPSTAVPEMNKSTDVQPVLTVDTRSQVGVSIERAAVI